MKSKIILVTGASSGIGFQTAQILANQGNTVIAAARRTELMQPLEKHGVTVIRLDVCDDQSIQQCVNAIVERHGRIDVLVNNAGYGYFGAIETVPMEEARRQLEVNVFGLARLCQLVLPAMRAQGRGRIVNTSSVAGKATLRFGGWYNVSKYSVEAFSDALRMEVSDFGINVSLIEPGGIKTEWGFIAADHLKESAKGGAYEAQATKTAEGMRKQYSGNMMSDPKVISKAISKAVNARRPKTRYLIGFMAKPMVWMHTILPTRWFDYIMKHAS